MSTIALPAPAAASTQATTPENGTLPAVRVSGQADTSGDFQPEKSSVGASFFRRLFTSLCSVTTASSRES